MLTVLLVCTRKNVFLSYILRTYERQRKIGNTRHQLRNDDQITKITKVCVQTEQNINFNVDVIYVTGDKGQCDVQLIKVAPDDGLIQSETCRASKGK